MRLRRLWLAGGLVCGLLGCSSFSQRAPDNRFVPPPPPRQTAKSTNTVQNVRKANDEPAKELQAKPKSCVSMADFYAECAADENRTEVERHRFSAEARKTYRRALQQDPKYLPAFLGLGRLAETMDDHEEAVAVYNEALAHYPKEATIWFERGVSLSRMKRFDEALASYQRAAQIDPKNKPYSVSAAYMLAMLGRQDEALTWMKRVMPEPSARYNLALALRRQGHDDAGRQQLTVALSIDPNHRPSRELLAHWHEPNYRGGEEPLQQTNYATAPDTKPSAPVETPPAVVIRPSAPPETAPATLPTRQIPAKDASTAVEKSDVNWNNANNPPKADAVDAPKAPAPLIPVLSEHWAHKPTSPPALNSLPPGKDTAAKPRPVAKLGFEEQP